MYSAIAANKRNTVIIIALFVALIGGLAYAWGYYSGQGSSAWYIIGFVVLYALFQYYVSSSLAVAMSGAVPITKSDNPRLWRTVENISIREGMPMPKVYVIPSDALNAFATGRSPKHAAVAATEGIMRVLTRDELMGVMAHELSHVGNRDILIGTIAAAMAGLIGMIANVAQWGMIFGGFGGRRDDEDRGGGLAAIVMIFVAPIAAALIQMAISRSREYQADASGAQLCGHPESLANALRKLEMGAKRIPMDATPATAHMFIVNPLRAGALANLFSTHPPMEERIARLEAMRRN